MKYLRILTLTLLVACVVGTSAQEKEQFSIATLNVDGLPQKIWFVKVNADGPGDAGTARIGKYLWKNPLSHHQQPATQNLCTSAGKGSHKSYQSYVPDYRLA